MSLTSLDTCAHAVYRSGDRLTSIAVYYIKCTDYVHH